MFGIGSEELLIIIIFSLLVFDPDKLPEVGRRLGRAIRYVRKRKQDVQDVVQEEVIRPLESIDDKVSSKAEEIENKIKTGSFEDLLTDSKHDMIDVSKSVDNKESKHDSDTTSQDSSIQKMTNLLYGIDNGEEDRKDA